MNKSELVAAVAAHAGSDQSQARRHVDAVFEAIMNSVVEGERVVVTGFGTFDRVTRPARTARNPRTGQPIQVASSLAPRFSVGRTFKENVSGGTPEPASVAAAATAPAKVSAKVPDAPAPDGKKKKKGKDLTAAGGGKRIKAAKEAKRPKSGKPAKSAKKAGRKGK